MFKPEAGAGKQKRSNFMSAKIEDAGFPIGMKALLGISMLEEMATIEVGQSMLIIGEVGRHPIENNAQAILVKMINEKHKILRRAVSAGWRKVVAGLVTPRAIKRMLGDR
jgi:hypothetical protein